MAILGAILGDIAGSQYEYDKPIDLDWKNCDLFSEECEFTDDTVMSLAIKYAIDNNIDYEMAMRKIGQNYPICGYGDTFFNWMFCTNPKPYNSFGNGSAMRVSYIGEYYNSIDNVIEEATKSAIVTHNHPEGIKGAITTAVCIWLVKNGASKKDILEYSLKQYPASDYKFSSLKSLNQIRNEYSWDVTCMTSVPVAIRCFYESDSYISFIRNVFSLDCDCDTLCAIGGGIAEEYYKKTGIKNTKVLEYYLDRRLLNIWEKKDIA